MLGCQVKDDGTPGDMLKDRLTRRIEVYNLDAAVALKNKNSSATAPVLAMIVFRHFRRAVAFIKF